MIRLTFACPAQHIVDANQLARVVGLGPDDDMTYGEPRPEAEENCRQYLVIKVGVSNA